MGPKRRGSPPKHRNRPESTSSQLLNVVTISDSSDSSVVMTGKRSAVRKGKGKASTTNRKLVPDVYQDMLAEALPMQHDVPERPLKRRRRSEPNKPSPLGTSNQPIDLESSDTNDEEDIQFEDVLNTERPDNSDNESDDSGHESRPKQLQTAYRDSGDESEESDFVWEGVNLDAAIQEDGPSGDLELTLSTKALPQRQVAAPKRKTVTKAERELRLQTHKLHVLCLLSYLDRRNNWCNDSKVQELLKPLINKKMLSYLRPKSTLSQFGQAESLKRGLDDLSRLWRTKFRITSRGMRRSLWAEAEQDLSQV